MCDIDQNGSVLTYKHAHSQPFSIIFSMNEWILFYFWLFSDLSPYTQNLEYSQNVYALKWHGIWVKIKLFAISFVASAQPSRILQMIWLEIFAMNRTQHTTHTTYSIGRILFNAEWVSERCLCLYEWRKRRWTQQSVIWTRNGNNYVKQWHKLIMR